VKEESVFDNFQLFGSRKSKFELLGREVQNDFVRTRRHQGFQGYLQFIK
jgi:hypothetical protein